MKPLRLWARNLRTWAELDVQVPEGVCAVVGANGAGKSSLVNVIDLALFGSGRELKRALSRGAGVEECEVGLEFEHRGERYRVRRSYDARGRGKPRLDLERLTYEGPDTFTDADGADYMIGHVQDWTSLSRETIDATEQALEQLLGLSRQTFRASSYLAQGEGDAFTAAPPRERKAILLEALGVRLWDRLRARAATERAAAEAEANRLLGVVEQLEGQVALRDAAVGDVQRLEQLREAARWQVEDLARGLTERREELEEAQAQAAELAARRERDHAARRRLSEARASYVALRERITTAEAQANGRTELAALAATVPHLERALELRATREEFERDALRLEQLAATVRSEVEELTTATDQAVSVVAGLTAELARPWWRCPTCKQPLEGEALETAQDALRYRLRAAEEERDRRLDRARGAAGRAAQLEDEASSRRREAAALYKQTVSVLELVPDAAKPDVAGAAVRARAAVADLAVLEERERGLAAEREQAARLEAAIEELDAEVRATAAAAAELDGVDVEALRGRVRVAEERLEEFRRQYEERDRELTRAKTELEGLEQAALDLERQREALTEEREEAALYRRAEQAYGRDGVPALILESAALPQLEAEANRIVGELGRSVRFELRTQRATQAGTVQEALDIIVLTEEGEAAYEDFSGGERTRLDLALRIALARLLAARRGADVRLLAIDEPAYLDAEGFERLAAVLRGLTGEFESVLVVSHVSELRDAFDQALAVAGGADTGEPSRLEEAA